MYQRNSKKKILLPRVTFGDTGKDHHLNVPGEYVLKQIGLENGFYSTEDFISKLEKACLDGVTDPDGKSLAEGQRNNMSYEARNHHYIVVKELNRPMTEVEIAVNKSSTYDAYRAISEMNIKKRPEYK